jgi:hypothetical protein
MLVVLALALAHATPAPAPRCVETTVRSVSTYFENDPDSGWDVILNGRIRDPYLGTLEPRLTDRSGTNYGVIRHGDRVRVCLEQAPDPQPGVCDPRTDPRGRIYRVYDYRLRATFEAPNGNHGCGGA